jgi:hypothetical protein
MNRGERIRRWNECVEEIIPWSKGEMRLQRAKDSVLHQLLEDWRNDELVHPPPDDFDSERHFQAILDYKLHAFVIEHDWARAFENSDLGWNGDESIITYHQPYEHCCFEFIVSGKRVCLISNFDGHDYRFATFVRLKVGWAHAPLKEFHALRKLLRSQHKAVVIALDAKVATTDVVRAPYKLNRIRERSGKTPLFDYHVVQLAHRTRPATLPSENESERNGVRLHFRRGHWRHFETFKTWINWMLVGDPDLGFIDKHYRL